MNIDELKDNTRLSCSINNPRPLFSFNSDLQVSTYMSPSLSPSLSSDNISVMISLNFSQGVFVIIDGDDIDIDTYGAGRLHQVQVARAFSKWLSDRGVDAARARELVLEEGRVLLELLDPRNVVGMLRLDACTDESSPLALPKLLPAREPPRARSACATFVETEESLQLRDAAPVPPCVVERSQLRRLF